MVRMLNPSFSLVFFVFQGVSLFLNAQITGPKDRFEQAKSSLSGYSGIKNASFSWCFRDAASGQILDSCHTKLRLVPASTAKIATSMLGLEILGPRYTYQTPVYIRGEVKRNQLFGDLIIVGSGDPSFGSGIRGAESADSILFHIYSILKKLKIKKIKGRILIDPHFLPYNHSSVPGTWQWDDIGNYYGSGIYGLNWRSNSFEIEVVREKKQNDQLIIAGVNPKLHNTEFVNAVKTNQTRPEQEIYIYSSPLSKTIFVDGNMRPETGRLTARGAIPNPPLQFGHEIISFLKEKRIEVVDGLAITEQKLDVDSTFQWVETFKSPPLTDLIREVNQQSNNLFAEGLFRTIGKAINPSLLPAEIGDTLEALLIERFKLSDGSIEMADGCGLSRRNLLTTGLQSELLASITRNIHFIAFKNSLAVAGISGTFQSFEKTPNLIGKTGSMGGVRAFSGYLCDRTGKTCAFSILVNNYEGSGAELKKLLVEMLAGASEHQF
jgi:D-alanyl-D-alanine carboxypeptidase/D-alanyl-D-alanine-endopeptidase (penicillin-binding protein 4)